MPLIGFALSFQDFETPRSESSAGFFFGGVHHLLRAAPDLG
ncbi:hypothetical protein [Aliiroseovarius marinus]